MVDMTQIENPAVAERFNQYPKAERKKLLRLRKLIIDTAAVTEGVERLEETLKWGEPAYLTKGGSTIRIGCSRSIPDQYAMYFHCQSKLVDTFKELYRDELRFDGNRAIVFNVGDDIPLDELKQFIALTLTYHKRKHLPLLGA